MRYLGNKSKIVDEILPIILEGSDPSGTYIGPFCGSCAVIRKVPKTMRRIANDKNPYMIALHKAIQSGWEPPTELSEEQFKEIKARKDKFAAELVGFAGLCTFAGTFFGTYARGGVNYANQVHNSCVDERDDIQGIEFLSGSFAQLEVPDNSICYCDPPYENTSGYAYSINNFTEFWKWADNLAERGVCVYVSGYTDTPVGTIRTKALWQTLWTKEVKCTANNTERKRDRSGLGIVKSVTRYEALFHRKG